MSLFIVRYSFLLRSSTFLSTDYAIIYQCVLKIAKDECGVHLK